MKTQFLRFNLLLILVVTIPFGATGQALVRLKTGSTTPPTFAGNTGYFVDSDGISLTDGTISGTTLLLKGRYSSFSNGSNAPLLLGKILYFIGDNGTAVYRTDGTIAGTGSINTPISPTSNSPSGIVYRNNLYFFSNDDYLVKSDGSAAGTSKIGSRQFRPTSNRNLRVVNDKLYFDNYYNTSARGLWTTDGTDQGTTLVKGIDADAGIAIVSVLGKKMLLSVGTRSGTTYFMSDGTPDGTVQLAANSPLNRSIINPLGIGLKDSVLYFSDGVLVWRTDFTDPGTYQLNPPNTSLYYGEYLFTDDGFFFIDKTTARPSITKVVGKQATKAFGGTDTKATGLAGYNKGVLYYTTSDDNTPGGSRIWRTDNTPAGTYKLINSTDGVENGNITNNPFPFVVLSDSTYLFQSTYLNGTSRTQLAVISTSDGRDIRRVVQDNVGVRFTDYFVLNNKAIGRLDNNTTNDLSALNPKQAVSSCLLSGSVTVTGSSVANSIVVPCGGSLSLSAVALGGTAPFTYQWLKNTTVIAGATSSGLAVQDGGDYFYVELTDAKGCKAKVSAPYINASPKGCVPASCTLTATLAGNVTLPCTTGATTLLTVSTNGTAPLMYQWKRNGGVISGATSLTYLATATGDYTVLVTDTKSCSAVAPNLSITGSRPLAVIISGYAALCTGQSATLDAILTNGTAPYSYRWKQNGNAVGANETSLSITTGGIYSVSVTDACSTSATSFTVTENPSPQVSIGGVCTSTPTGLTAIATGGTAPYGYQWSENGFVRGSAPVLTTVTAGSLYAVYIYDAEGCSASTLTKAGAPSGPLSISLAGPTVVCSNQKTLLDVAVTNSIPPLSYQWQQNGSSIGTNASAVSVTSGGIYSVTITDACSTTSSSFTIADAASPTLSIGGTLTACSSQVSTLTATVAGGVLPYTYLWKQGSTVVGSNAPSLTVTGGNNYALTVTDAKGCATSSPVLSISAVSCASVPGRLAASASELPDVLTDSQITLYPNPTTGDCWVRIDVISKQTVNFYLVDALGKSVRQWSGVAGPDALPIRVSLPDTDGLYFLRVGTESGTVVKKVLRLR